MAELIHAHCSVQNHYPTLIGIFENSNFKLTKEALCLEQSSIEKPKSKTDISESESSIPNPANFNRKELMFHKIIKKARQAFQNKNKDHHDSRDSGSRPKPRVSKARSIKSVMRPNKRIQSMKKKEIAKKKANKGIININSDHRKVMKYIQRELPKGEEDANDQKYETEADHEQPTVADHHGSVISDIEVDLLLDPFSNN
jgi:hypothetical protein